MGRHPLTRARRSYDDPVPLPDWLLWLLPLPIATSGAIAWGAWRSRTRRPQEPHASMRAHERFQKAMAAPLPPPRGRSGSGRG